MEAVKSGHRDGWFDNTNFESVLEHVSEELKSDKEFVMAMVENVMAGLNHK